MPKNIGLVGLGKTNLALLDVLLGIDGIGLTLRDSRYGRKAPSEGESIRIKEGGEWLSDINEEILFLSPSVRRDIGPLEEAAVRGASLSSDCEMFFSAKGRERVFAVTGSDGKSTVTDLTARLLSAGGIGTEAIGNCGTPYIARSEKEAYVTELSSFNLEYLTPESERAVITSITPNHLNWHTSYEEYIDTKMRVLTLTEGKILSLDSEMTAKIAETSQAFAVYSLRLSPREAKNRFRAEHYYCISNGNITRDGEKIIAIRELGRPESYNIMNAMAALALTDGAIDKDTAVAVLSSYRGLAHRCELIYDKDGIRIYDSSIDTSPQRSAQTITALGKRARILLGGRGKGLSLAPLTEPLTRYADRIAVYGDGRDEICDYLRSDDRLRCIPSRAFHRFEDAVEYLLFGIGEGETAILSPAHTAYGEFTDFEERGECFKRLVLSLLI